MKTTFRLITALLLAIAACASTSVQENAEEEGTTAGEDEEEKSKFSAGTFAGLKLRGIGPAFMSGRISDIAVDPARPSTWYLGVASGNVWKTNNAGTTWKPIFDDQGSYAIGCLALDPRNPQVVWVGTGENNSQRSVGYGDGIYKSLDGGKSWKNVGLKESEHIGKILIHPEDSDTVYVAAQGPLWAPGGDRGLYKTTDGGENWELVLEISENTGVTDVELDPRDPDVLYATSYQRRRHVGILIGGGPESGIHKSTDGGATWRELKKGIPGKDKGRIELAVSPVNPDVIYATVEATGEGRGFYRSLDCGESWKKENDYYNGSGQYYGELFADPWDVDKVYVMDTRMHVTLDGGKSFDVWESDSKHVDNHAVAFFEDDPAHLLIGCDGGLYETFDSCETFKHFSNLPLTQFYNVGIDNESPFYHVYGGTQDNATIGGPIRTNNTHGIRNSDWFITVGGDGFQTRVDPSDPNILYSQSQHAGIVRFDRRSGERVEIQPQPAPGEPAERWHWNSPLIISPHSTSRLYFASQHVFRSDDRGDSWEPISPDLSRGIDRNQLEVMGTLWSVDAVNRNSSSSFYGTVVSLDESALLEGLLYAGTDDGLIQVSGDGGGIWRRIETFPDVPPRAYSSCVLASLHDVDTVYATFENHKRGDFAPYVVKSTDRGLTWTSIAGDLPEDEFVWCIVQDHVKEDLLFAATEFGVYFTVDGGGKWVRLKGGIPTISIRDMEIQRRENDLVLASFGRGFYVLDDYSPLREVTEESLEAGPALFPVRDAWWYVEANPLGGRKSGSQGDAFYRAPNPPFGAVFSYYLKDGLKTKKELRQEAEKELVKAGEPVPFPDWDDLEAEAREEKPAILLTVRDVDGNVVTTLEGPKGAGLHRVDWELRYPAYLPAQIGERTSRWGPPPRGPLAVPGNYSVSLSQRVNGVVTPLAGPVEFETRPLGLATLPAGDREQALAFQQKFGRLQRASQGASRALNEAMEELKLVQQAIVDTPGIDPSFGDRARAIRRKLQDLRVDLSGDATRSRHGHPTPPSISRRISRATRSFWTTGAPTGTQQRAYEIAAAGFAPFLEALRETIEVELKQLEEELEAAGAPWTPGRGVPRWEREK